jgi:hypothetical protein
MVQPARRKILQDMRQGGGSNEDSAVHHQSACMRVLEISDWCRWSMRL